MTDDAYGATIAKRRLARRLAELRVASGYTANHVCDILNWGRGKVGRFEANQWKRPEMSDIRDLLRIYNADSTTADELEDLAIRARARPWWREYPEIFGNEFPGFENDASQIRVFMPLILPGLLQTAAYVEAGLRTGPRSPAWRQKALETRLRRQEILTRNGPTAVITEAALLFRWGTRADQYEQIAHLAEVSGLPNVELRIQRFADGPYPGMLSMINIFGFPDGEPSLVFMETDYAIEEVSSADSVTAYEEAFSRARDGALEPTDTAAFLRQLAEQLE
jgi:transcriptional regulator with XRE-family HTH domain